MHARSLPRRFLDTWKVRPNSGCQRYATVADRKLYAECRLLAALGAKDINPPAERVRAQRLANQRGEPIHPLAEIDRLHRDQNLRAQGGNDHVASFIARTILASVAPLTL